MNKYQVQYRNNSKTFVDTLYAKSSVEIISLFQDLINAELTEIREVVYENPIYPKDDGNYGVNTSVRVKHENYLYSFKIPKRKKTLDLSNLDILVKKYIKVNGFSPENVKFK